MTMMFGERTSDKKPQAISTDDLGNIGVKGFQSSSNSVEVTETNPESERYLSSTPVDEVNETDGTYYEYLDMAGYRHASLQLELDGGSGTVTVTVEGSIQDDGTAAASAAYQDISLLYGASSWTADAILTDPSGEAANFRFIRTKRVHATTGSNNSDAVIYAKQWN